MSAAVSLSGYSTVSFWRRSLHALSLFACNITRHLLNSSAFFCSLDSFDSRASTKDVLAAAGVSISLSSRLFASNRSLAPLAVIKLLVATATVGKSSGLPFRMAVYSSRAPVSPRRLLTYASWVLIGASSSSTSASVRSSSNNSSFPSLSAPCKVSSASLYLVVPMREQATLYCSSKESFGSTFSFSSSPATSPLRPADMRDATIFVTTSDSSEPSP
mmetsp:Transcript_19359/g.23127  ORF Transcript_19359/g.23127 Transcript_19359/m.23127 type:complete len:217 (-) Transcript_19359:577-1227(-)